MLQVGHFYPVRLLNSNPHTVNLWDTTGTDDKSAPDARLIAQAIFLAVTDPSPPTRDAVYLVPAIPEAGGMPVKCIPNSSLSISTVDPYKSMMRRFGIIIMCDCPLHSKLEGGAS